jgi:hypothetical protein
VTSRSHSRHVRRVTGVQRRMWYFAAGAELSRSGEKKSGR